MGRSLKSIGQAPRHGFCSHAHRAGRRSLWRLEDFQDCSFTGAAQALSRLKRAGLIERLSKGIYYRPGVPHSAHAVRIRLGSRANLLGFSMQTARRAEVVTTALSLPRKLVGSDTIIHTRRPERWADLSETDTALLNFLRRAGRTSELSPEETARCTVSLLSAPGRFERLLKAALSEPPRVRAILGAIGEQRGKKQASLESLRASLNPRVSASACCRD